MLTIIAAVAANNVIGNKGKLPWHIPKEMKLFKKLTMNHIVIMGRKTFESIGHELPNRKNIVISSKKYSLQQALDEVQNEQKAFVIGGASVYAQMMPFVDELLISHLKQGYQGDIYFPIIGPKIWNIAETQDYSLFKHIRYIRNSNIPYAITTQKDRPHSI